MMGKVMYMPDELFLFSMYVGENVVLWISGHALLFIVPWMTLFWGWMEIQYVFTSLFVCIKQVLLFLNDIFDTLLKALSDPSDEVICSWCLFLCLIISFSCIFMLNFYSNKKASFLLIAIFFWNSVCCTLAILQFFLATALKCIFTFNFLFYWDEFKTILFEKLDTFSVNFFNHVCTSSIIGYMPWKSSILTAVVYYWGCLIIWYAYFIFHFKTFLGIKLELHQYVTSKKGKSTSS